MARLIILASLLIIFSETDAQIRWHFNFTPGLSYVPQLPLTISQENQETINLWARYESVPLKLPPYYSVRFGFGTEEKGWEIELNHLKVYLKNKPAEVERFSISHGYNQVVINRIFTKNRINSKAGLGIIAAHPENTVRGLTLNEKNGLFNNGYYITGPIVQYGIFKEVPIGRYLYLLGEVRISAAYARVPVVNGNAHAPVLALHLQIGPGFRY